MTDSIWDGDDGFAPAEERLPAAMQEAVDDHLVRRDRALLFKATVNQVEGPLGALLRQIAHAHNEFEAAEKFGGVTVGEETRINGVLDEAMSTLNWLGGAL